MLIDPNDIVTHINEIAGIILGIGREEALGSPFDDLDSNSPHYLRVRSALRALATEPLELRRIEVDLHVRGRDHIYVLKRLPLRQGDGQSFGAILILQDITYLRDKDRAHSNLVAPSRTNSRCPLPRSDSVSSLRTGSQAQLKVCDSGPGIPPEVRQRLFERFTQWNVNGAGPGSAGLGLAIAKEIVEARSGRIFVESAPGKGACFTVELPAEPADISDGKAADS